MLYRSKFVGVDKTFNLCDMHVTILCYKQTSVVGDTTHGHPIIVGPVFIYDKSGFESYIQFFNHIRTELWDIDIRHGPFDILGGGGGAGIYVWAGNFFSDNIGAR